jgi:hypothetical protein
MQVITPGRATARRGPGSAALGALVGILLLTAGLALAYLAIATPFMDRIIPTGWPNTAQVLVGLVGWSVALVGPTLFLLLGATRLASVVGRLGRRGAHPTPAARLAGSLPDDLVAAIDVDPGDGRYIPEIVVGPFGMAVLRELPPSSVTRHAGSAWELHTRDGWVQIENPLERASRDAERVRRWVGSVDHDFVAKVHAAVVGTDDTLVRTPSCAVIRPDQVPAWLASLPAQRSLTASRRDRLVEMIRAAT